MNIYNQNQLNPDLQVQSANNIAELVDRFGGDDSNMRMQLMPTVVERVDISSTPEQTEAGAEAEELSSQPVNACYANGRSVSIWMTLALASCSNKLSQLPFYFCYNQPTNSA